MTAHPELLLANARVVLADRIIERGWVAAIDGLVVEVGEGRAPERGEDLKGDLLLPGLVELHTDHIEAHYAPRPKVYWDLIGTVVSYDGHSGITTVLDSLRVWREEGVEEVDGQAATLADAIAAAPPTFCASKPTPGVVAEAAELIDRPDVRLLSLMDHTPGQRQFRDEKKLRAYYRSKKGGMTDAQLDVLFARRLEHQAAHAATNYRRLVGLAQARGVALASHDDTTLDHVNDA